MESIVTNRKRILRISLWGFIALLIPIGLLLFCALSKNIPTGSAEVNGKTLNYGVVAGISNFFLCWKSALFPSEAVLFAEVVQILSLALFVVLFVAALVKKEAVRILPSFLLLVALLLFGYLFTLVIPMIQLGVLGSIGMACVSASILFVVIAMALLGYAVAPLLAAAYCETIRVMAGPKEEPEIEEEDEDDEQPAITEHDIRLIARDAVHEHELHHHKNDPIIEEIPEAPKAEAKPEPKEEKPAANHVTKFETRVRNSEYDLRHKYYDLRDYLVRYGAKKRITVDGASFMMRHERLAFMTIENKDIYLYLPLDAKDYAGNPYYAQNVENPKYEGLTCVMRVRSDRSFPKAKELIDKVMEDHGVAKPVEKKPAETKPAEKKPAEKKQPEKQAAPKDN